MLYLISLGLSDEKDMSLKALEATKKCNKIYLEPYTNKMETSVKKLEKLIGKKVIEVQRSALEEDSDEILKEAKTKDIGVLVAGDALSATTHISLILDSKKQKIPYRIIHGSSIFTAIGETGLQIYKFGKTTTLTNHVQKSTIETIKNNQKLGLHTLVLLDIKREKNYFMDALEALEILKPKGKVIVACQLGTEKQIIVYGKIEELSKLKNLKRKTPAVLIAPGELHFLEEEFLEAL